MTVIRVAAKAFIVRNNCFLLLERCQSDTARHPEYDIPGGGVENGESYLQALEREITEETGLKANIRQPLRAWNYSEKEGEMLYGVTFAADYISGTVRLSDEHQAWQWIDFDNLETLDLPRWIKEEARLAAQIVIPASSAVCPPQITRTHAGVYGIIRNACNQLLVIRKRRGPYSGRFDLPGGSTESGESEIETLARELEEETGCRLLNAGKRRRETVLFTDFDEEDGRPGCLKHTAVLFDCTVEGSPDDHINDLDSNGALWIDEQQINARNASPLVQLALKK